jgi:hypothetical protein
MIHQTKNMVEKYKTQHYIIEIYVQRSVVDFAIKTNEIMEMMSVGYQETRKFFLSL